VSQTDAEPRPNAVAKGLAILILIVAGAAILSLAAHPVQAPMASPPTPTATAATPTASPSATTVLDQGDGNGGLPFAVTIVLSLVSGLVGAIIQRIWQDSVERRRDKAELLGALLVVRYEVSTNLIAVSVANKSGLPLNVSSVSDSDYRQVNLLLARQLKDSVLRRRLVSAYLLLARARQGLAPTQLEDELRDAESQLDAELRRLGLQP